MKRNNHTLYTAAVMTVVMMAMLMFGIEDTMVVGVPVLTVMLMVTGVIPYKKRNSRHRQWHKTYRDVQKTRMTKNAHKKLPMNLPPHQPNIHKTDVLAICRLTHKCKAATTWKPGKQREH